MILDGFYVRNIIYAEFLLAFVFPNCDMEMHRLDALMVLTEVHDELGSNRFRGGYTDGSRQ